MGYIPYGALDTSSTGRTTRESSRTLEVSTPTGAQKLLCSIRPISPCFQQKYAFEDFAIRQVALLLNKTADEAKYANRSLVRAFFFASTVLRLLSEVSPRRQSYRNVWDPDMTSDGFQGKIGSYSQNDLRSCAAYKTTNCIRHAGFMQKRFPNGTFATGDPADCSPKDQQQSRECSLQSDNTVGFYESSSWEYSWFAPHDTAHLVTLMGGNVSKIPLDFCAIIS